MSAKQLFAGGVSILPKISTVAGQPMLDVASGNDAQRLGLFFEGPPIECSEGTGEFSLLWGLSLVRKSIHSALQSSKRAVSASVTVDPEHVVRQEKIKLREGAVVVMSPGRRGLNGSLRSQQLGLSSVF